MPSSIHDIIRHPVRRLLAIAVVLLPCLLAADWRIPAPGRVRDLSVRQPEDSRPAPPSAGHYLVKLSRSLDAALLSRLREAGTPVTTQLSADSAVVFSSGARPAFPAEVVWFGRLAPQDKAPEGLLAVRGAAMVSVLGHPGTRAAELAAAARREGLNVAGLRDSPFGARLELSAGSDPSSLARFLAVDGVFAVLPRPKPRIQNDLSIGTIQSEVQRGPTPIFDHGIFGVGETVGVIDTGLDVDSCFFADGTIPFVIDTWSPDSGYGVVTGELHRKIAAYDFLHSCDQFPMPCDRPDDPLAYDNEGHGTHVAGNIAGDNFATPLLHDHADGMAPGARLVVQDAGYDPTHGDCGDLPGLGCAPGGVEALFDQAFQQGARIHNDSWADDPLGPPPANAGYSLSARDVDDFVFQHPDFLPFFPAGNSGGAGPGSIPSPGNAKNVVCVGSTRNATQGTDDDLSDFSGIGPAADGRIKPDVVAPGVNVSASSDFSIATGNCGAEGGAGTSFSTPIAAGAGALVREYFDRGFYPAGAPDPTRGFSASAALVKATLVAGATALPGQRLGVPVTPPPSVEQGFGRIDLSRALAFQDSPFRILAVDRATAFSAGDTSPFVFPVTVRSGNQPLRVVLAWTDPPGVPRAYDDPTPELVDDLDLTITAPGGIALAGNTPRSWVPGAEPPPVDHLNNVERVILDSPPPGLYTVTVTPSMIAPGPAVGFALLVAGDISFDPGSGLIIDAASASLRSDPNGDGFVGECETLTAALRVGNVQPFLSSTATLVVESLDSAVEVLSRMPLSIAPVPPGGTVTVAFDFRASANGIPLRCGQPVPFRIRLDTGDGLSSTDLVSFAAPPEPPGCGDVASLTCAPLQVRPIRPH
jgi:hypothetical protein